MLKLTIEWAAFSLQKTGSCVVKRLQFELFGKTGTQNSRRKVVINEQQGKPLPDTLEI